jgi:hypothetical protein
MLTQKEAFRAGFLARCAEEGLAGEALSDRMEAAGTFAKFGDILGLGETVAAVGNAAKAVISAVPTTVAYAAGAGVIGGAALGAGAGALAGPEDPGKIKPPPFLADVQKSEYAAALRQQAEEMRRLRELNRPAPTPSRSRFGV